MKRPLSRISVLASLSAILVLGALLRYIRLAELPPGLWFDEAWSSVAARSSAAQGVYPVYYDADFGGMHPAIVYLARLAITISDSPLSLRYAVATVSTCTLAISFLTYRAVFGLTDGGAEPEISNHDASRLASLGRDPQSLALLSTLVLSITYPYVHFRRLVEGNVYRIPDQIDDAHPTLVWLLGETDVLALPPRCLVYPTVEKQSFTYLIHTPTAPTFLTELQTAFPTGRLSGTITSPLTGQTLYEEFTMTTGESTSHRLPIRFGDVIELVANPLISMTETAVRVVPTWQAAAQPEADYTLFVHLYPADEEDSPPLIQLDKQPCLPTSQWRPGELIQERYSLPLPRDLPSGDYALVLGWYTWPTLERLLPDSGAVLEGDRLLLAELSFPDSVRIPP